MRFLKLSTHTINVNNISYIEKCKNSKCFYIVLNRAPHIDGFTFFGTGAISSYSKYITVKNGENDKDYDIVEKWLEKL